MLYDLAYLAPTERGFCLYHANTVFNCKLFRSTLRFSLGALEHNEKTSSMNTASMLSDGTKRLCLSEGQFAEISAVLRGVYQKTKCSAAILSDESGVLIAHSGTMPASNMSLIAAVAAGKYAATNELARLVGEDGGFRVHFHEGVKSNLFLTGVDDTHFLAIVFGPQTTFGMVRVLVTKAGEQLVTLLEAADKTEQNQKTVQLVRENVDNDEFRDELSSRLDAVLFGGK